MIREIDHPTAERIREDMIRRLRVSLHDEMIHCEQIIASNVRAMNRERATGVLAHKARAATYRRHLHNLHKLLTSVEAGDIAVVVKEGAP